MKRKMPGTVSRRKRNVRRIRWSELSRRQVQTVNIDPVLPQIGLQHKFVVRVGDGAMHVRGIVSAERKAARRRIGRLRWPNIAGVDMHIDCRAQRSIRVDWYHCETASTIIGDKDKLSRR